MKDEIVLTQEYIMSKIYVVRGQKVMLDKDLADLYRVETKQLKRQVRRNSGRFPSDFMFELSDAEFDNLRCQFGTSSWGGTRYLPMAFTEQGVSMLSSILNSQVAIDVNIQIIRTFTKMRELVQTSQELLLKMEQLENRMDQHDEGMNMIFQYLRQFMQLEQNPANTIGYK